MANQHPQLSRVFTTWSSNVPQLTLTSTATGRRGWMCRWRDLQQPANGVWRHARRDFSINNRVYHVVMQNEMQWRERAEQISELYVRSRTASGCG
jgi:multidrug efflux pump subunit AcrB